MCMAHTFEGTRMKLFAASLAFAALGACTPQPAADGAEAVVTAIYDPLVSSKGQTATPIDAIPMTADLKDLVIRAEAAVNDTAPVFDGDVAGNCQDCTGFTGLKIGPTAEDPGAANTHKVIEANFTIQDGHVRFGRLFENQIDRVEFHGAGSHMRAGIQCMLAGWS